MADTKKQTDGNLGGGSATGFKVLELPQTCTVEQLIDVLRKFPFPKGIVCFYRVDTKMATGYIRIPVEVPHLGGEFTQSNEPIPKSSLQ